MQTTWLSRSAPRTSTRAPRGTVALVPCLSRSRRHYSRLRGSSPCCWKVATRATRGDERSTATVWTIVTAMWSSWLCRDRGIRSTDPGGDATTAGATSVVGQEAAAPLDVTFRTTLDAGGVAAAPHGNAGPTRGATDATGEVLTAPHQGNQNVGGAFHTGGRRRRYAPTPRVTSGALTLHVPSFMREGCATNSLKEYALCLLENVGSSTSRGTRQAPGPGACRQTNWS